MRSSLSHFTPSRTGDPSNIRRRAFVENLRERTGSRCIEKPLFRTGFDSETAGWLDAAIHQVGNNVFLIKWHCLIPSDSFWFSDAEKGDYYERGWPDSTAEREPFWPNEGYIVSKVGISALTRVQQRQFDQDQRQDLTVNCVHPGYVRSILYFDHTVSFKLQI